MAGTSLARQLAALEQELGEVSRLQSVAAEFGRRELEEELRSVEATLHQLGVARVRSLLLWLEEQPLAKSSIDLLVFPLNQILHHCDHYAAGDAS